MKSSQINIHVHEVARWCVWCKLLKGCVFYVIRYWTDNLNSRNSVVILVCFHTIPRYTSGGESSDPYDPPLDPLLIIAY